MTREEEIRAKLESTMPVVSRDDVVYLLNRLQFMTDAYDTNAKVHEALTRDYLAAKRDIKRMLQDTDTEGFCVYCQHLYREACDGCEDAEWRGPQEGARQ